jgi:hypothetical protein
MRYAGISVAPPVAIRLSDEFLGAHPDVYLRFGERTRRAVVPGMHFGSRYPGDPRNTAVWDCLPEVMLHRVVNAYDFVATAVLDLWISNCDTRQAIFVRQQAKHSALLKAIHPLKKVWSAIMIDQGNAFGGSNWHLGGQYSMPNRWLRGMYSCVRNWDDLEDAVGRIQQISDAQIDHAMGSVPDEWSSFGAHSDEFYRLRDQLQQRRFRLRELLDHLLRSQWNPFHNWGGEARQVTTTHKGSLETASAIPQLG